MIPPHSFLRVCDALLESHVGQDPQQESRGPQVHLDLPTATAGTVESHWWYEFNNMSHSTPYIPHMSISACNEHEDTLCFSCVRSLQTVCAFSTSRTSARPGQLSGLRGPVRLTGFLLGRAGCTWRVR